MVCGARFCTCHSEEYPWACRPPEAMKIGAVVPAKAGTDWWTTRDSRLRGNDEPRARFSGEPRARKNLALCRKDRRRDSSRSLP